MQIHLVSHTHWDREWYHLAGRFRQRLVELVDDLLDDPPAAPASFLLDGQAVILEDYLSIRPERSAELSALLRNGRLEAGPWYVLADELIPSGEALVRNLLAGKRVLASLRAVPPPVLYSPDSFGHPAALPELAAGFAVPVIVIWRGFGGATLPRTDAFSWVAPSGATAVGYHLPRDGYETGTSLPAETAASDARWARLGDELRGRNATGIALLTNGADHHARQPRLRDAMDALARAAGTDAVMSSSMRAFADALVAAAGAADLPSVTGELRDSYGFTWTLQGTFATRAAQKRRNASCERALVRDVEPWSALARLLRDGPVAGGDPPRSAGFHPLERAAWRELLRCHPHDTLCGCSIDGVARAMEARLDEVESQVEGLRAAASHSLLGHDPSAARAKPDRWRPTVIVRNPAPRPRSGVAMVAIDDKLADEPVGPASAGVRIDHAEPPLSQPRGTIFQPLDTAVLHDRLESPHHYPDNDLVRRTMAAVWVADVDAYGIRAFELPASAEPFPGESVSQPAQFVATTGMTLDNGILRVEIGDGEVKVIHIASGHEHRNVVGVEDFDDRGDSYTPSLRGSATHAQLSGSTLVHAGPLRGEISTRWNFSGRDDDPAIELSIILDAGAPFARLQIRGENRRGDHRLRVMVGTSLAADGAWADAAFGPVFRTLDALPPAGTDSGVGERVAAAPPVDHDAPPYEQPLPTAPLHRYVSIFDGRRGATIYSDGLAEYEHLAGGTIAVTLLRAIGELSRHDLPERPGHAGWPAPIPEAQSLGPFEAHLAFFPHGGMREDHLVDEIERIADDVLLPLSGATLRAALDVPQQVNGFGLSGTGLAFGCARISDDGGWIVLRCVNLLEREVGGEWHLPVEPSEVRRSRLDETPGEAIVAKGRSVPFTAGRREPVTILIR